MINKFEKGHKVIVCGPGQNNGDFYRNKPAIIIEKDPYFKDYLVRFENGTEDWILPKYIRKPWSEKGKRS